MDGQTAVTAILPENGGANRFYWLYFNRARIDRLEGLLEFDLASDRPAQGSLRSGAHAHRHQDASRSAALTVLSLQS